MVILVSPNYPSITMSKSSNFFGLSNTSAKMTKKLSGTVAVLICIVHILLGMALTKNALFCTIVMGS